MPCFPCCCDLSEARAAGPSAGLAVPILLGAGGVYLWLRQQLLETSSATGVAHGREMQTEPQVLWFVSFADARNSGDDLLVPDELKASLEQSGKFLSVDLS